MRDVPQASILQLRLTCHAGFWFSLATDHWSLITSNVIVTDESDANIVRLS